MTENILCPCDSGIRYANCCQPLLMGTADAVTAVALMRSRYTAYVVANVDHLLKTWHPSTRPDLIDPATITAWCGLTIIDTEAGGRHDEQGEVEFEARAVVLHQSWCLRERSRFVREDGKWLYIDGEIKEERPPMTRATKIGRNEPCPCGSGKKTKRCCGAG